MESPAMTRRIAVLGVLLFAMLGWSPAGAEAAGGARSPDGVWSEAPAATATASDRLDVDAPGARHFQLDDFALFRVLRAAPPEFTHEARTAPVVLTLPLPDGTYSRFAVV